MKKLIPALAAGAVAVAVAFSPAITASAAPSHAAAKASKQYTLSVDGNGKHATVVWTTLTVKSSSPYATKAPTPVVHTVAKAHEPWRKHVKSGASLYEIAAVQTTGSTLSCTIKNTHGTVVAHSTSRGKNTIVTCIVAKDALLAGVGGTGGTASGSGSSTPSLLLPVR
jgi:hypothetical protein